MNTRHNLRNSGIGLTMVILVCLTLCGCDHSFFESEGDCDVVPDTVVHNMAYYQVHFKYDYNMSYTDAFAQEVQDVTLYLIDEEGQVVLQREESGSALAEEGYLMELNSEEVQPGRYSLLAWCGTKDKGSFTVNNATLATELQCTLNRNYSSEGTAYVESDLDRLFHGYLEAQEFPEVAGTYSYTVSLTKNTNAFHVTLQHTSGSDVDVNQYNFSITDDNGLMDWDNNLIPDELITYYAWYTGAGTVELETRATYTTALAELTTGRLVTGNSPHLTVTEIETEEEIFSIPLLDYVLLAKDFYDSSMDNQEFLDREDEYDIVFFLDDGDRWMNDYIYINSWKVVLKNTGF